LSASISVISDSNKDILEDLGKIKENEKDELKEIVMTRNSLLMKLIGNKEQKGKRLSGV